MDIVSAAYAFRLNGQPISCINFGHGHINSTFKITTDTGKEYVLQKINKYVFKDPVKVMANACAVTEYLRSRSGDPRSALHFIPTLTGQYYHRDQNGEFWRIYDFVGGFCMDMPETDQDFYESALAFGKFQQLLSDFPAHTLHETIPNFHNTINRFSQLKQSIVDDNMGRKKDVLPEIELALSMEELGSSVQKMWDRGELPLRVTHNDTKLNNVLLDKKTRKSLCVLDLDTVMPGLSIFDFGDSIRFGAATAAEDEPDTSKMKLDLHLFRVYTQGYLEAATTLTELEIKLLPMGAFVMTLEVGIRFLKDYLDGDIYFNTAYPEHNLVRARTQLALAVDIREHMDELNRIVAEVSAQLHK